MSADIGNIFTLLKIFFFYEMILKAKAMSFWENMTRSEIFFSVALVFYPKHMQY